MGASTWSSYSGLATQKDAYKNDFRDSGGLEKQSIQELENYAVYKAEATTQKLNDCRKIAEEIREGLGLSLSPKGRPDTRQYPSAPTSACEKVEVEKAKQDDMLSDLSDLLGQLKEMALDMGTEIERQNASSNHFHDDVKELRTRVNGANLCTRRLLGR